MVSVASSSSVASMQKWGIPGPESSVLERLVWVRYANLWWPAILYQSYMELQEQMYPQFSSYVVKAQFALAIMRQMQEKRNVQVARLLGRKALEIVEVDDGDYFDFYWNVADLLPEACDKANYAGRTDLFLDVHKALDEVEEIFREVTNESILLSPQEQGTWLERAQTKIRGGGGDIQECQNDEDISVNSLRRFRDSMTLTQGKVDWGPVEKQRFTSKAIRLDRAKSPKVQLATLREEPPSLSDNSRHKDRGQATVLMGGDFIHSSNQIEFREISSSIQVPRPEPMEVPTDELAQLRREKLIRSCSRGTSTEELSQTRREQPVPLESHGTMTDKISPSKRDMAVPPSRGPMDAPSSNVRSSPPVAVAEITRKSFDSRSRGSTSNHEKIQVKRDRLPSIYRSSDVQSKPPPVSTVSSVTSHPPTTIPRSRSRSKGASTDESSSTTSKQHDTLPHHGSTDTLLRARYSPAAAAGSSVVDSSSRVSTSANSLGGNKSVRSTRNSPTPPPLRPKKEGAQSKDRKRVTLPMQMIEKTSTGLSRADTERVNNLSDNNLPANPSMPLTPPQRGGSSTRGISDSKLKYRPSRMSSLENGHSNTIDQDRNPPSSVRPTTHSSLLMESQRQSHHGGLLRSPSPLPPRDQSMAFLPFCGVRMT